MAQSDRTRDTAPGPTTGESPAKDVAGSIRSEAEERHRRISDAAYYRAERRGFHPGSEHDDWLEAEQEVDRGTPTDKDPAANDFPSPK